MEKKNIRWEIGKVVAQSGIGKVKNKRLTGYLSRKKSLKPSDAVSKFSELSKIVAQRSFHHDEVLLQRVIKRARVCIVFCLFVSSLNIFCYKKNIHFITT